MKRKRPEDPTPIDGSAAAGRGNRVLSPPAKQTERAEEELAGLFSQSVDLLCIAGFDGHFKRLNPAWTVRLGWSPEEGLARPFLDFVHPDDKDATLAELDKLAKGAETILFDNRYQHRDGTYRWLQWNARPVPGRQRIYATARDITHQKQLEKQVLMIVDRERERLGQELHDGLCQVLAGVAAMSSALARRLEASAEPKWAVAAAEITGLVNDAIQQTREMAQGLGPLHLDKASLDDALESLALSVEHQFSVSCSCAFAQPPLRVGIEVGAHVFRIAQEAVNNAVAHGRAEHIEIRLETRDGNGHLAVRDDGVGFPGAGEGTGGLGLRTMAYRSRLIGGSIDIRRRDRSGTEVTCVFPLPAAPDNNA